MARHARRRIATATRSTSDSIPNAVRASASEVREAATDVVQPPRLFPRSREGPGPAAQRKATAGASRWRPLFSGAGPREILARIVPDDPLGVRAIVARRMSAQALLIDADRAHVRSLALCARWAPRYDGQPELDVWLEQLVDQALAELAGDGVDELAEPEGEPASDAFETLARPLHLDAGVLRGACRAFNRLPLDERRVFFEFVLRNRSLDEVARECSRNATDVARLARRAIEVFFSPSEPPPQPELPR